MKEDGEDHTTVRELRRSAYIAAPSTDAKSLNVESDTSMLVAK
jgi:hypothetical protein